VTGEGGLEVSISNTPSQIPSTHPHQSPYKIHTKQNWTTFTYIGPETNFITKLFKHTNLKIAYRTSNNIQSYLSLNPHSEDIFAQSGVYKLTCPDCGKVYVGQTGRDFKTRLNEHKCSFTHNKTSKYTLHLLEHSHTLGSMHDVMQIIQLQKKGIHVNTIERFHIHKEAATNNHLNDDYTLSTNRIFDTILRDFHYEVQ